MGTNFSLYFLLLIIFLKRKLWLSAKLSISLIFNTNMALGCMLISMKESDHSGVQWSNIFDHVSPEDTHTFFNVIAMFYVDSIIYFLLALYISNVFPGEYGIPKKWYYFLQASYYRSKKEPKPADLEARSESKAGGGDTGIQLCNMCKSYNKGKTFALKPLNLRIKQNEITVLLGHNGAGRFANLLNLIPEIISIIV